MKKKSLLSMMVVASIFGTGYNAGAQGLSVNTSGAAANASAILDVSSTTQGMLVPRMTAAQRTAIVSVATGLLVYQTDGTAGFYFYNGSAWVSLSGGAPTGSAGGDLTGSYPNPTITNTNAAGNDIVNALNSASSKTGSGSVVFATSPTLSTPFLGTIQSGDLGNGTNLNATQLLTGTVPTARLGSGTANSTTFLRGDGTWAAATVTDHGCQTYCFAGVVTTFTVPTGITSITITAVGGNGGYGMPYATTPTGALPGLGAMVSGTIAVTAGHVLDILVGAGGADATLGDGGGGGGGDFCLGCFGEQYIAGCCGGGGGGNAQTASEPGGNGQTANGSAGALEAATSGTGGNGAAGTGGGVSSQGASGSSAGAGPGAGGAGWGASSASVTGTYTCSGGIFPLAGTNPGQGGVGYAGGGLNGYGGNAGYGGGGGGNFGGGGGGGGYNGGGGGNDTGGSGGGGGSYFNGGTATKTGTNYMGAHNGSVVITW